LDWKKMKKLNVSTGSDVTAVMGGGASKKAKTAAADEPPAQTPVALGLKWKKVGSLKPRKGREISNEALAAKVQQQLEFTEQEWVLLGIKDLRMDDFVKAGGFYFRPVGAVQEPAARETAPAPGPAPSGGAALGAHGGKHRAKQAKKAVPKPKEVEADVLQLASQLGLNVANPNDEEFLWIAERAARDIVRPPWVRLLDENDGRVYYFNGNTQVTAACVLVLQYLRLERAAHARDVFGRCRHGQTHTWTSTKSCSGSAGR
jgi:hypothetical protein